MPVVIGKIFLKVVLALFGLLIFLEKLDFSFSERLGSTFSKKRYTHLGLESKLF